MCLSKAKIDHPNVRTLNTLLRGCLWCAATTSKDDFIVGGVVTAEIAWKTCKRLGTAFDVSSYQYSISLLCQALRVEDAMTRISEMKNAFGLSEERKEIAPSDDQSLTEAIAMSYCALARAYTILNKGKQAVGACETSLAFARTSKDSLKRGNSFSRKRGWKETEKKYDDRRAESNTIYRNHRLTEIETETRTLIKIWKDTTSTDGTILARGLARRLITRLIFLSGGGTTDMQKQNEKHPLHSDGMNVNVSKDIQRDLLNSLYFSYGLAAAVESLGISMNKQIQILRRKDCNRILGSVGLQGGILKGDGRLDLHRIFSAGIGDSMIQKKRGKMKSRRVELELGAGFGDWIVRKAIQTPSTDYLAVELRADRVAQISARTAVFSQVKPVDNLCVVGGDSRNLLCNHISNQSVDAIYVNHPEPPTQTFGAESTNLVSIIEGGQEPAHMLNSSMIIAAGKSLKRVSTSKLVIVTDNLWYGRLICATIEKVMRHNPTLFDVVDLAKIDENQSFKRIQTNFIGSVLMFEGLPNETIGYPSDAVEGGSYFDRLWRAGAGTHAEKNVRYIIAIASVVKIDGKRKCK